MELVEAAKTPDEVAMISRMLGKHGGTLYADIWNFGLQVALRISDLLDITMAEAQTGRLTIREGKTGKPRQIALNNKAQAIVEARHKAHPDHTYLFQVDSNRAKGKPISRISVAKKFQEVGEIVGIKLGTHSMRKTRGWIMHSAGVSIEMICKVLNHSSPSVTMHYIGLTQAEVDATYEQFEIWACRYFKIARA